MNKQTSLPVALLVLGVAILCMLVIASGMIAPNWFLDTLGLWAFLGATLVMAVCAVLSFWLNLPGTLQREL